MLWYFLAALLGLAVVSVYGIVVVFSHNPRPPLPSESKFLANDGKEYNLPPRASLTTTRNHEGIKLSVVIPCYNERQRLGKMLDESLVFLQKEYPGKYEVLIVDDGSSDGTGAYALEKSLEYGLPAQVMRVVTLAKNRGKGGAVTHGLLHARGEYALFADADGATTFGDITGLTKYLDTQEGHPAVAIGSRAHMVNTDAVVKRSFIRNLLMYGLHTLVFIFGIRNIQDTQCGFKVFNYDAIRAIFPNMHTERWIFDVEVLLLAELQNIPIKEVAVNWQEIDGSKVNLASDSIDMAKDLVVTRLAYLLGVYKVTGKKEV